MATCSYGPSQGEQGNKVESLQNKAGTVPCPVLASFSEGGDIIGVDGNLTALWDRIRLDGI